MSSKSKEGNKPKTTDYVDALSDAVMRIFSYSNNENFISKCFSYLKVDTPIQARKQIQKCFQNVIGLATGSKEIETNFQTLVHDNKICSINVHKSFDETGFHSACASNYISYSVDDTFEDTDFNHYSEQYIPDFQKLDDDDVQFSNDSFVGLTNESLSTMCLTSTPYESVREGDGLPYKTSSTFALGMDVDFEDELEVLRCTDLDNDKYFNDEVDVNEEIESSYGSLNFSIPDITEPTPSEYSVNFSHPEYLNESYLLRDLTDLLGQSDEAVDIDFTSDAPDMIEVINKGISSQELVDKALSSINESLLVDAYNNTQSAIIIAPEREGMFTDHTDGIMEISALSLQQNYVVNEKQKTILSKSAQNFESDESDCVIVYDTSENRIITEAVLNNNNSRNQECNDVDLILIHEFSHNSTGSGKSSDKHKLVTEIFSNDENSLPNLGDSLEKPIENFDDDDDMETQYECYFDSNGAVDFEKNLHEKSTDEEDTDNDDDESRCSHKNKGLDIKYNSKLDHCTAARDDNICRLVEQD